MLVGGKGELEIERRREKRKDDALKTTSSRLSRRVSHNTRIPDKNLTRTNKTPTTVPKKTETDVPDHIILYRFPLWNEILLDFWTGVRLLGRALGGLARWRVMIHCAKRHSC